jgi:hypothetical protein
MLSEGLSNTISSILGEPSSEAYPSSSSSSSSSSSLLKSSGRSPSSEIHESDNSFRDEDRQNIATDTDFHLLTGGNTTITFTNTTNTNTNTTNTNTTNTNATNNNNNRNKVNQFEGCLCTASTWSTNSRGTVHD